MLINTGTTPVVLPGTPATPVPAGPFLRFVGTGMRHQLRDPGPRLSGAISLEQTSNSLGQRRTVLAVAGGGFSLDGTNDLLTGVQGLFVLAADGVAGQVSGNVNLSSVLPSGVTVAGTFGLVVNQTSRTVTENVTLDGTTLALNAPAGPYQRVYATGVRLSVGGQTLTGDLSFERQQTLPQTPAVPTETLHGPDVQERHPAARRRDHRPGDSHQRPGDVRPRRQRRGERDVGLARRHDHRGDPGGLAHGRLRA